MKSTSNDVKGLDPRTTGLPLRVQPVVRTVVSPLAGRLSARATARSSAKKAADAGRLDNKEKD